jgi:hypothetical protein
VLAFAWERYKPDRDERESDWPLVLSVIAFTPLLFDVLEVSRTCQS